ncbi:SigE family RNA polymerase sigma factor [soil metagenome]
MNAMDGLAIDSTPVRAAVTADDNAAAEFSGFYAANRDAVFRAVLLATRHPQRAEDAVQEAFSRAYARWDTVREFDRPRAWVSRVALNVAISWWRRLSRERSDPPDRPAHPDEGPMDPMLVRLVWSLPLRQRQVVALRVLADLSIADTARILGIADGTVKAQLHRALRRLRDQIEAADGPGGHR